MLIRFEGGFLDGQERDIHDSIDRPIIGHPAMTSGMVGADEYERVRRPNGSEVMVFRRRLSREEYRALSR